MGPTFSMPDNVRTFCYDWAANLRHQPSHKNGNLEQAAMGRFGECAVFTWLRSQNLETFEGPKFKNDLWVRRAGMKDARRIEVKTRVQQYAPRGSFHVLVRQDTFDRQVSNSDLYVFVFCYKKNGGEVAEIVGFELAENIAGWEVIREGQQVESGHVCRYSSYRTRLDNLKPIEALPSYLYYVNDGNRLARWND
jgi:hypothetical protein